MASVAPRIEVEIMADAPVLLCLSYRHDAAELETQAARADQAAGVELTAIHSVKQRVLPEGWS